MKTKLKCCMLYFVWVMLLSAQGGFGAIYNVKNYGALGNGTTDDTVSIRNAINAANNASGTNTVYFPAGTYLVNNIPITKAANTDGGYGASFLSNHPANLIFEGDGPYASILKRNPNAGSQTRILTIWDGSNLTFQQLGFDHNNIYRWGGNVVRQSANVTVQKVHCFDSNVYPGNPVGDHYGWVFTNNCTYVKVLDTHWENLQLEIDACQHVQVLRNVIDNPLGTGGFGAWAVGGNTLFDDYLVQDNWIIDVDGNDGAISFKIDNATMSNVTYSNLRVLNNTVIYNAPYPTSKRPPAIKFGVATSAGTYSNIVFNQITVENNKIYVNPGISDGFSSGFIYFNAPYPTGFKFDNTTVRNNTLYYNGVKGIVQTNHSGAKGVNWVETNNVKTSYVTPPTPPNPLAEAVELLTNGAIETNLAGWTISGLDPGESVSYDTSQKSPFANAYTGSAGSAKFVDVAGNMNGPTLSQTLGTAVSSGVVTFNYDFRLGSASTNRWAMELHNSSNQRVHSVSVQVGTGTNFYYINPAGAATRVQNGAGANTNIAATTWYNVFITADLSANTVTGMVSSTSGVIGTWTSTLNAGTDIKKVVFKDRNNNLNATLWIDNVSLTSSASAPPPLSELLTNGDIEGNLAGWTAYAPDAGESVAYDTNQKSPFTNVYTGSAGSARFIDVAGNQAGPDLRQALGAAVSSGVVTFNFDFRLGSSSTRRWGMELYNSGGTRVHSVQTGTGGFYHVNGSGTATQVSGVSIAATTWYNVFIEIDLATNSVVGAVSTTGGVIGTWTATIASGSDIKTVVFKDRNNSENATLWIDNVSLFK